MKEMLLKIVYSRIYRIRALISGIILILLISATLDEFFEKLLTPVNYRLCFYGLFIIIWISYWLFYRFYIPKNRRNKVGIVIAIHTESNHEEIRIKEDFIKKLRRNIRKEKFGEAVNLIRISNHQAEQLNSKEDVLRLHKRVKGHFYLYGNAKRRMDGKQAYFLQLDGMIVHKPIPVKVSKLFSQEFRAVLPQQISFYESLEFQGFQFTADIVYLAVRYVIGIAAFFSGDIYLAHSLHSNLKQEFNKFKPLPPNFKYISDKSSHLLSDEKVLIAKAKYYRKEYQESKEWLKKALETYPNNYGGWLLKAIFDFILEKDVYEALKSIRKAEKYAKGTYEWRYSRAFLYFWLENYKKALKVCNQIYQQSYSGEINTALEVESFVLNTLENNREKVQLYYWLGFLNFRKIKNLPKALEYFETFEKALNDTHDLLKATLQNYLAEIRKAMSIE